MTNQEYYEKLYNEYAEASSAFLKLEREISSTNGFGNFIDAPNYLKAEQRWRLASNYFHNFLSSLKGKKSKPRGSRGLALYIKLDL